MVNFVNNIMENKEKIIKSKELLIKSWEDFVKNWSKFIMIYLYSLLGFLPMLAIIVVGIITVSVDFLSTLSPLVRLSYWFVYSLFFIATVLLAVYYSVRAKAATYLLIKNNYTSASSNFKESEKYFWGFLGVSFLSFVVVLAWGFVFIIPALIFGIYYSFASFVLVAEEKRAFSAMERSYDLVRGYWLAVFGRMCLLILIAIIIFAIISFPLNFMSAVSWPYIIYNIFTNLIWLALAPYFVVYYCSIYTSLKNVNK